MARDSRAIEGGPGAMGGVVLALALIVHLGLTSAAGKCEGTLFKNCNSERLRGLLQCAQCTGSHQSELHAAGCENQEIQNFCENKTCATQLSSQCGGGEANPASAAKQCKQCTACTGKVQLCKPKQDPTGPGILAGLISGRGVHCGRVVFSARATIAHETVWYQRRQQSFAANHVTNRSAAL